VKLAIEMAREHQAPALLAGTIQFLNEAAQAQGYGTCDTAVMWKVLLKMWEKTA
jgi:3-hydroxyisobutyrate dehydrogenase-like beta-hydroxyacid dehydrogenase